MANGARGATLYLRGLPVEVIRESKARAARRGITLTQYVTDLLHREASDETGSPVTAGLAADLSWYGEHRERLAARYAGQYLAVADQQVVDHDAEFAPLASRVLERFGDRPVLMPKCTPTQRVLSLPSPRLRER